MKENSYKILNGSQFNSEDYSMTFSMIGFFKKLNRSRRNYSRYKKMKKYDLSTPRILKKFKEIKRVAVISTSQGYGDSLFVMGIIRQLEENGKECVLIIPEKQMSHYTSISRRTNVFPLENSSTPQQVKTFNPTICVDLTLVGNICWKERAQLLSRLKCLCVTLIKGMQKLNLYDRYVDLSGHEHISERYAHLMTNVLGEKIPAIKPYISLSQKDLNWAREFICKNFSQTSRFFVYLNSEAGDEDRELSQTQLIEIINFLNKKKANIICFTRHALPGLKTDNLVLLPKLSFEKLAAVISMMDFCITPDTSVTHLATVFNISSFVIFPPNDRDYWSQYPARQVWGGRSDKTYTFYQDNPKLQIDNFGYPNYPCGSNAQYRVDDILRDLEKFLTINQHSTHDK